MSLVTIIHTPHGHIFYGYYGRLKTFIFIAAEFFTALITDAFIALTEGEKRESLERHVGHAADWFVIPSGVDFEAQENNGSGYDGKNAMRSGMRAEFGIPDEAIVAGTVARLEPVKGVNYFIRAAADILAGKEKFDRKLFFVIAGNGPDMDAAMAEAKGFPDIIFTGYRNDVLRLMAGMDLYVQPSVNEGMGRTLVQAQYMGLPLIGSRVCGIPDIISDGENGLLVPSRDRAALAVAITRLVKDPEKRAAMGISSRQRALKTDGHGLGLYGSERMTALIAELYEKLSS